MKRLIKSPFTWGVLAALLVLIPHIHLYDFIGTDCIQMGVLEGTVDFPGMKPYHLYHFADGTAEHAQKLRDRGLYPWFTADEIKMNFCRHLASCLTALNHEICGLNPMGYIIHSLFWYLAVIIMVGIFARSILPPPATSSRKLEATQGSNKGVGKQNSHFAAVTIALILFALPLRNAILVFYGSARWLLIASTLGLLGLVFHIKWRQDGWKPGRYLSIIFFILALLTGEAALAVMAFLVAYELFGRGGREISTGESNEPGAVDRGLNEPLKKRIIALLPAVVLVFIYLVFHRLMGYGAGGFEYYIHPFDHPLNFLISLPQKMLYMFGEMMFSIADIFGLSPQVPGNSMWIMISGAGALVISAFLYFPVRKSTSPAARRSYRWLFIGMLGAMLPLASVESGGRVVHIPFIAGSILLGCMMHSWWKKFRSKSKPRLLAWIGSLVCLAILGLNIGITTYGWFKLGQAMESLTEWEEKLYEKSVLNEIKPNQTAVFLNGTGISIIFSGYYYRKVHSYPMPAYWRPLSFAPQKHYFTRTAGNTLRLDFKEGSLFDLFEIGAVRSRQKPLKKGDVIELTGLRIRILEVNESGPTSIEYVFDYPLEDERYCFYKFYEDELHLVSPPALGQTLEIVMSEEKKKEEEKEQKEAKEEVKAQEEKEKD